MLAFVLFVPGGFILAWPMIVVVLGTPLVRRVLRNPPEEWFRHIWPMLLMFTLVMALMVGAVGAIPGVSPRTFLFVNARGVVANGDYQDLGVADGQNYLMSCHHPRSVVSIATDRIVATKSDKTTPNVTFVNLWDIVFNGASQQFGIADC